MLQLAWPWALAAIALPVLVRLALPRAAPGRHGALVYPFYGRLGPLETLAGPRWRGARCLLASLAWALLVAAAARPQTVGEPLAIPLTGRDLMLAVDISSSMQLDDLRHEGVPRTRLDMVKQLGQEFLDRRLGDRVGLILFGTRPYLQAPLTFDRGTVARLLSEAIPGLAGDRTALGDAIALGVQRLAQPREEGAQMRRDAAHRVLILVTDGASTAGRLIPLAAAAGAARAGITIHAIGVGTRISDAHQRRLGSRHLGLSLDEETLQAVARHTGGRYFRAPDRDALVATYAALDRLEPAAGEHEVLRPVRELYPWPLAAALACAACLMIGPGRGGAPRPTTAGGAG